MSAMADVHEKIRMLEMFRLNPDRFLPVADQAWKVFPARVDGTEWYDDPEYNLGWDTGLLEADRPYFMEAWASGGITMLTYFVSAKGIEDASEADLIRMLTEAGLFRLLDPEFPGTSVMEFKDGSGNEFFSVNVTVGMEDDVYAEGGTMYPYGPLNKYNSGKLKGAEKE